MNKFDIDIIDILIVCALSCGIGFAVCDIFMSKYLFKNKLVTTWTLLIGSLFPWEVPGKYLQSTKEEYGRIGVWFKLFVMFMSIFIIACILLIIIAVVREIQGP